MENRLDIIEFISFGYKVISFDFFKALRIVLIDNKCFSINEKIFYYSSKNKIEIYIKNKTRYVSYILNQEDIRTIIYNLLDYRHYGKIPELLLSFREGK